MTWSLSTRLTQLITTIVSLAILGRLLTPEDFGIFGIVIAINAIVMPVLDLGLQPVYVKLKHATEEISNVFFTTNLIVGLILALILTALAPIISKFYDLEILGILLLLLSVSIVFSSLSSQPRAVLAREKKFDQLGSCQISVSVSGAALGIIFAWLGFGIWALLGKLIYESISRFILLTWCSGRHYSLVNLSVMSRYTLDLKFGKDIVLARLIDGIVSASDKLILAKMISIGDLGAYTRSQQFAMMPDANIRTPITTALLSYLAGNDSPLKTYLNMTWLIYAVAGFPCFLLISHGEKLLPLLLGEQWVEYGWMLRWLGIVGLAKVVQGIVVIVNINDKKAKYTIKLMAFSSVPSIFLPFLAFIVSDSFHVFLATMAFLLLIYWSCALIITLWSRYPDESLTLYINFLFIILSAIATMTAVDILGIQNVLFAALVEGAIFLGLLIIMKWRALLEIGKLF